VLLAPGCGPSAAPRPAEKEEPVRRASYRGVAARDFLAACPGPAARRETAYQDTRFAELKQLAARNGAGRAVALGENEWAGMRRYAQRTPCAPGEAAYRHALAGYSGALDALAAQIAAFPRQAGTQP
jgi:hypothetical protein